MSTYTRLLMTLCYLFCAKIKWISDLYPKKETHLSSNSSIFLNISSNIENLIKILLYSSIHIDEIIKRHSHIEGDNEITPVYKPTRRHSNIFDDITLIKTDLPTIEETENAFTQDKF